MNTTFAIRPLIYIFSDSNFLALSLLENLLAKNCLVNIVTNDVKKWSEKTAQIANKSRFSLLNRKDFIPTDQIEYAVFSQGFVKNENSFKEYLKAKEDGYLRRAKSLILCPYESFSFKESSLLKLNDSTGVIYLGDLIGPRMDLNNRLFVSEKISEILTVKSLTFAIGEVVYPLFVQDAAKTISKWLFSFGPYGQEVFLLGPELSAADFWKINQSLVGEIKLKSDQDAKPRQVPRNYEVKYINSDPKLALTEMYKYMALGGQIIRAPKIYKPIRLPKKTILWVFTGLFLFFFPFITFALGSGFLYFAYRGALTGRDENFQNMVLMARINYIVGGRESGVVKHIPVLGRVYRESEYISIAGERISDISLTSYPLIKTSSELFTKILGNDIYNPQTYSDQIKAGLGSVYQNILILEADTKDATARKLVSGAYVSGKVDFEKIKNISQQGDHLLSELPSILGKGKKQTYLILFQNNMELRPTGGFIGSYAVSTFDGGRMSELNINDVYSADGQLRGHVDPPDAIKNYLGEANWWLRDSNWDPDFPTSAKRAEWFLDKEVDTQVDGVISIDLSLVRDLLKYTGSIFLPDYNLDITSENLYERTQAEVLDNFFPGSRKKASFLTALSRNLLTELGKISGRSRFYTLKAIFDNLEKRHVQVFLHNDVGQNAISLLGWSGEVGSPDCGDGCYLDLVAPVEANVGVNKANYFVKRSVSLNVNYANGVVERALTLNLKNSANTALGASGKYKAYIRVLVPADSEVVSVRSILGQSVQVLNPEVVENKGRKEIGVLIETVGGQSQAIDLIWRSSLPPGDSAYQLYFRKQAGVEDYPLTLTINGAPVYNTTLSRDIWTRKY